MPVLPKVNSFLLCDYIIQEHRTGKKSLIGIFHNIIAGQFPFAHPSLFIYANLSDAMGTYDFEIRLLDLETGACEVVHDLSRVHNAGTRLGMASA